MIFTTLLESLKSQGKLSQCSRNVIYLKIDNKKLNTRTGFGLWVFVVDFHFEFADGWDPDARMKISKAFCCKTLLNNN